MKYAILTFGCRANQADSFDLERELRARGAEEAGVEAAELVVVNTCAVTATAEQAARQAIRRVARLNPAARIVATGCYATREPRQVASLPVWRVVPNEAKIGMALTGLKPCSTTTQSRSTIPGVGRESVGEQSALAPSHVAQDRTTRGMVSGLSDVAQDFSPANDRPMPGPGTRSRTLHLLRVQTGCNERCTYCVVPATRGPSRSVPLARVVSEVRAAADAGFKETTITGVHLGCYGRDLAPSTSLADLLRCLCSQSTDVRFRLSAVEPMDFTDDVIDAVAGSDRFARHFHLPLQHASDRVLSAMARPYTLGQYGVIVGNLLDLFPDAAIGTDLIVGFPGETEADFEACATYLATSRLAYVHVFPFSPRPGTPAARLGGRPRGDEVRRRVGHLRAIAADLVRQFRARFVGSVRDGLTIEDGTLVLTDNYLRVRIAPGFARNERVKVSIVEDGGPMTGLVINRGPS
jgi:threonylcarbamoyladenosine tRNA methylthiotransferase MtaB